VSIESYRRVVPSFWTDPDVRTPLAPADKLVLLYFVTSPHSTMIGLYNCPLMYASREIGLPETEIRRAIVGVLAPFVTYDEVTEEVFVHAAARHQIGVELKPSDHRHKAVQKIVQASHSPNLKRAFLERYADWNLGIPLPDRRQEPETKPLASPFEAPPEAPSKGGSTPPAKHDIARQGKAKISADKPAEPKATWLTPYLDLWAPLGLLSPGEAGRYLAPLRKRYGDEQVRAVWDGYCREAGEIGEDAGWSPSPAHFARQYGVIRKRWGKRMTDGGWVPIPDAPEAA
jgi:hypothetical protein